MQAMQDRMQRDQALPAKGDAAEEAAHSSFPCFM